MKTFPLISSPVSIVRMTAFRVVSMRYRFALSLVNCMGTRERVWRDYSARKKDGFPACQVTFFAEKQRSLSGPLRARFAPTKMMFFGPSARVGGAVLSRVFQRRI